MQFDERGRRYPADADLHACARDRIEHPRRYNRDDAGLRFDLHEPPGETLLAAAEANAMPVEGMPAINGPRLPARNGQNDQEIALTRKNNLSRGQRKVQSNQ